MYIHKHTIWAFFSSLFHSSLYILSQKFVHIRSQNTLHFLQLNNIPLYEWQKTTTTTTTTTTNASVDWLLDTTPILSFNKQHSVQLSSGAQVCPNLQPYELYHARNPCPSSTPRVYPKSCPLSQWCHLMLWCQLLLPLSIFPSIRVFSNQSVLCIRWPKFWSFSFNISPSNEYSGLISFRMDRLDLLAVQGTLKSLLQHRSSRESIVRCSASFIVQLS